MRPSIRRALVLVIPAVLAPPGDAQTERTASSPPSAVSPGSSTGTVIAEACPTFTWSEVDGSSAYEIVVYRVDGANPDDPVLRERFEGAVYGWTPSLDLCLERGVRYAWSVRSHVADGPSSGWSSPSFFEVVAVASDEDLEAAVALVRRFLDGRAVGGGTISSQNPGVVSSADQDVAGTASPGDSATSYSTLCDVPGPLGFDTTLQVNGLAVVTAKASARYLDKGDGTVLDCNTGLLWLKNANCFGFVDYAQAESDVGGLGHGECGLTDESSPGDWRLPSLQELCSGSVGVELCPAQAASDSLIDSSLPGSPKVVNAAGDGPWVEGDAFDAVQPNNYWSGSENGPDYVWIGQLGTGFITFDDKINSAFVWPVRDQL